MDNLKKKKKKRGKKEDSFTFPFCQTVVGLKQMWTEVQHRNLQQSGEIIVEVYFPGQQLKEQGCEAADPIFTAALTAGGTDHPLGESKQVCSPFTQ